MTKDKSARQMIWGIALTLAGVGVFFRTPQVMPEIESIEHFSSATIYIRFCFYLIGTLLIIGGIKKIYDHYLRMKGKSEDNQEA